MDLAEMCYGVMKSFPREEICGMTSQIRRAATAIPANIVEGRGKSTSWSPFSVPNILGGRDLVIGRLVMLHLAVDVGGTFTDI